MAINLTPVRYFNAILPFTRTARRRTLSVTTFSNLSSIAAPVMASLQRKVLVPIANGSETIEAVVLVDILRRAGADVTVASVEKNSLQVDCCDKVKIVADAFISDCAETPFDLVSLPGGLVGSTNLRECQALESIVKKHVADGKLCGAICAAPAMVLEQWGLLKGLKATGHPSLMDKLLTAVPVESRVQVDGLIVTSRGPGTALEFALVLVEQLYGKEKYEEVAGPLVMRSCHGSEYNITEINSVKWTFNNIPQILVPIANGTEEMEAVIIIDGLRRANCNVIVASVEDKLEIVASRKVKLVADMLLEEAAKMTYDLIILPGGLQGAQTFSSSDKLIQLLKKQTESNKYFGAICASPALVLEPHGLLKGKKATAFPALCNKLSDQSAVENRVLVDGNLITSRGPGTTMEFTLGIVEKLFGRELALDRAKKFVFTYP